MDVGIFKASRARLITWIVVPPLLIVGMGLGTHALQRESEWELSRTEELVDILPKLVRTQRQAGDFLAEFNKGFGGEAIESEDQLISFLQETAQRAGFTVDSVKVERRVSKINPSMPVLSATVKGTGSFDAIELYLGDVTTAHHLLSESKINLSQVEGYTSDFYRAELAFELMLFPGPQSAGGGAE